MDKLSKFGWGKFIGLILGSILLIGNANAVKVAVLVEFPEGDIFTKCITTDEGTNGYDLMQQTGLDIAWSPAGLWGHGLCAINGYGCPPDNCYCSSDYWGFLIATPGDSSWGYMPVGFDAPGECWNRDMGSYGGHYCAQEGDVLGFRYGQFGDYPVFMAFTDICKKKGIKRTRRELSIEPSEIKSSAGVEMNITIKDANSGDLIKNAKLTVYKGPIGSSEKIFEAESDDNGLIKLKIDELGSYKATVVAYRYPHETIDVTIEKSTQPSETVETGGKRRSMKAIETTTTSSTSTTTTIMITITTTTSTQTTTTLVMQTASQKSEDKVTGMVANLGNNENTMDTISIIVAFAILVGLLFFVIRKKR